MRIGAQRSQPSLPLRRISFGVEKFRGSLAPSPGDFRDENCWPDPGVWPGRGLVIVSDPLEYRPECCPGGSRLGAADFTLINERLNASFSVQPDLRAHVIFLSANLGTWNGDEERATLHVSDAWRQRLGLPGGAWCARASGAGFWCSRGSQRRTRHRCSTTAQHCRSAFWRPSGISTRHAARNLRGGYRDESRVLLVCHRHSPGRGSRAKRRRVRVVS